jgi:hypothetical protein
MDRRVDMRGLMQRRTALDYRRNSGLSDLFAFYRSGYSSLRKPGAAGQSAAPADRGKIS